MSIKIHHGPPGSYKTSGAVQDDFIPAVIAGRVVVTNVRGLNDAALVRSVLSKPPSFLRHNWKYWPLKPVVVPDTFNIIWIDTTTIQGRKKLLTFFHWAPQGAFFIIDEAQMVFPKALTAAHLKALDFPEGVEAAAAANRPPDFLTAFDMHRHYNWDMVLTTPCISKIRGDIRDASESAFKHRNSAMVGIKGRYREGFHSAEDTGKSDSDIISNRGRKIKKHVWKLYASTATGTVTDTTAGQSFLKNPKILSLLCFLAFLGIFVFTRPAPKALASKASSPDPVLTKTDPKSGAVSSVPSGSGGPGAVASVASASAPDPLKPYGNFQFRLLGSVLFRNAFHIRVLAFNETRQTVLSDADLVAVGYSWRLVSSCHAVLSYKGEDTPLYCSESIPSKGGTIDPVKVASSTVASAL